MTDAKDRREARAGDAACLWHVLDRVLPALCGVRDELEDAELQDLAEGLRGPIKEVEAKYDEAVREVVRLLKGELR